MEVGGEKKDTPGSFQYLTNKGWLEVKGNPK
jgi:hypothetical protein